MERKNLVKYVVALLFYNLAATFLTGAIVQGYLKAKGLTEGQIYTYFSIATWAQVASMAFMTFFSSRIKRVKLYTSIFSMALVPSGIILILSAFIPALSGNALVLVVFLVSAGSFLGLGVYNILTYCLPYTIMDMKEYGRVTGLSGILTGAIAFGISTFYTFIIAKGNMVKISSYFLIFAVILLMISAFVISSLKEIRCAEENTKNAKEEILAVFRNKDTYLLIFPNFVRGIAVGIVGVIAVMAMEDGVIIAAQSSLVAIVLQVGALIGNLIFVLTCKKFKTRILLLVFNSVHCISLPFVLSLGTSGFVVILGISLIARYLVDTAIPVMVTEIIPKNEIGPFTSIRMLVFTAGQAVAPMLITPIASGIGNLGVLIVAAILQFLCGLIYYIVAKSKNNSLVE